MKFNRDKFEAIIDPVENNFFDRIGTVVTKTTEREINAKIALRLLDYIDKNQITQRELALKLGVKPQYVSRLLAGQVNMSLAKACQYGDMLGISLVIIPPCQTSDSTIGQNKKRSNVYSITFSKDTNKFGKFKPGSDNVLLS